MFTHINFYSIIIRFLRLEDLHVLNFFLNELTEPIEEITKCRFATRMQIFTERQVNTTWCDWIKYFTEHVLRKQ